MWQTYGHEGIKHILEKHLKSGQFFHAYLFAGPEGIGKKKLAMEFAGKILGSENPLAHPDFRLSEPEGEMTVEGVRDFISKTGFKPFTATHTVSILDGCERLNVQSSNALLKTLEEPSPSSIFILISATQKLLPTILSRCQIVAFNAFTEAELEAFSRQKNLTADADLAGLSGGSLGQFMVLAGNDKLARERRDVVAQFRSLRVGRPEDKLLAVGTYADLETEDLRNLFTLWLEQEKKTLSGQPRNITAVRALWSALMDLKTNKNKKLILQRLFLTI